MHMGQPWRHMELGAASWHFFEGTPRASFRCRKGLDGLYRRPVTILTVNDVSSHFILGNHQVFGDCFLALIFLRHA